MTRRRHARSSGRVTNAAMHIAAFVACGVATLAVAPATGRAQPVASPTATAPLPPLPLIVDVPDRYDASALGAALEGLGTTARVLMIGAHPDDEDTELLAWLARGRHVETAYLSLTRGDGGQNLIGNELGEALGAIRTQELLAARRVDGARQYFSRAYDFGFSKTAEETFEHWPRDSVLDDVVRVVRAFRPHVIVAVFSGTPRDGHGHHQASGQLAREAWDRAADTTRFPVASFGLPWTPTSFFRTRRSSPEGATARMNVGAYDAMLGRSYAEIAAESRSQHRSQGFGALQRRGVRFGYVALEASRATNANGEDLFAGIDTTWMRLGSGGSAPLAVAVARADSAMRAARAAWQPDAPADIVPSLAVALRAVREAMALLGAPPPRLIANTPTNRPLLRDSRGRPVVDSRTGTRRDIGAIADPDRWTSLRETEQRLGEALVLASGLAFEASTSRGTVPVADPLRTAVDDSLGVDLALFNRGRAAVRVAYDRVGTDPAVTPTDSAAASVVVLPDSALRTTRFARASEPTAPWWRAGGRRSDLYVASIDARDDAVRQQSTKLAAVAAVQIGEVPLFVRTPIVHRFADPVLGDRQVPVAAVPGITLGLERFVAYIRADVPVRRALDVRLLSAYPDSQTVSVSLALPNGLRADSSARTVRLAPATPTTVTFQLSGTLPPGRHELGAVAVHDGSAATRGYATVAYEHIEPQRLYSPAGMFLSAVEVDVPPGLRVAYVPGVGDEGVAALRQLGIPVEVVAPEAIASTDLSGFTTVVLGPRAYQASDALRAANPKLFAFAERGGTLVVQYGQYEMLEEGMMPFPIRLTRPAARVTLENAPVDVLAPASPLLTRPNRLGADDWSGWVQERALYMPSGASSEYRALLSMHDPDEPENRGALLTAPLGKGLYVYTTLSLFRQLPVGVPGAARLLVNLLSAQGANAAGPRME